jgi:hypothetical protein
MYYFLTCNSPIAEVSFLYGIYREIQDHNFSNYPRYYITKSSYDNPNIIYYYFMDIKKFLE